MKWIDKHIEIDPPKKPKKLTATRLGTILGVNPWSTDFEIWCAVTRTYEKPFEDTIYTVAGKTIEPKQIAYMKKAYVMTNLKTPTDIYGENYFSKTYGDFFHDTEIFGGMWDSLLYEDGKPSTVLEFKTTKRSEDWKDDIPEYYAIQAALYAYLLGVDDVIMIASFLAEKDYKDPDKFEPTAKNTITVEFKVSERYPNFSQIIDKATEWWNKYVVTGISPDYDEKKDAEILKELRTNNLNPDTDIQELVNEAETLITEIDKVKDSIDSKEKRLKKINEQIKAYSMDKFRPGDTKVEIQGTTRIFTLSRSDSTEIDKEALEKDGLLEKYTKKKPKYTLTNKEVKEDVH